MTDQASIDDALLSSDDRYLTVVARLSPVERSALAGRLQSSAVTALRDHAAQGQQSLKQVAGRLDGVSVLNSLWLANAVALELDTDRDTLEDIAGVSGVERLHTNFELRAHADGDGNGTPVAGDDVEATNVTYGLDLIDVPETWSTHGTQGGGVDVAVLDTGVDDSHPDLPTLSDEQWQEFDDKGNPIDSDPYDSGEHGTHVSGTVVGSDEPDGDVPGFGVAPGATLYHGLVIPAGGGSFTQVVAGMQWAVDQGVDVINMSLGGSGYNADVVEPSENARNAGVVLVASAGNSGDGSTGSPGNVYPNVASGAVDSNESVADFSSGETIDTQSAWGDNAGEYWPAEYVVPDVAAPGVNVLSSVPGGGYDDTFSGTSMSSPHQAGAVVLMLAAAGGGVPRETLVGALEDTASKPDDWDVPDDEPDTRYGLGVIDVAAATALVALDTGVEGVVELDGQPVEGAAVEVGGSTVETDGTGVFSRPLEPGEYDLTVSGFGIQETTVTVTVEDGDSFTDVGVVAVDLSVSTDQPGSIEGGSDVPVSVEAANVDTLTIAATGDYDPANADLFVDGQAATFGDPVSLGGVTGKLGVTVETTADTAGTLGLDHTADGPGGTVTATTGPTEIFEELTIVGVVDAGDSYGQDIVDTLGGKLGGSVVFEQPTTGEVVDSPGQFDVVVAQLLADDQIEAFVDATGTTDVGVVYLDQWDSSANAVPQYAGVSDWITETDQEYGGGIPGYVVNTDHSILDGFGEDETVLLHDEDGQDATWFETDGTPEELATLSTGGPRGTGLAVYDPARVVFAASLGLSSYVSPEDLTDAAVQILGQAVTHVAEPVADGDPDVASVQIDPAPQGGQTTLTVSASSVDTVTVAALWADWDVTVDNDGGANGSEDRVATDSEFELVWDSPPRSPNRRSPSPCPTTTSATRSVSPSRPPTAARSLLFVLSADTPRTGIQQTALPTTRYYSVATLWVGETGDVVTMILTRAVRIGSLRVLSYYPG